MHVGVPAGQTQQETVSTGTDAASRRQRRAWRNRLNGRESRKTFIGVLATLAGACLWGFSGPSASMLFDVYHVDTLWLLSVRQIFAGLLFMVLIAFTARDRFVRLWTNPAHIRTQLLFTLFGLFANQLFYLIAIRLTNAGTATVLQCLELIIIMVITCVRQVRGPRKRELAGLILALLGTFLIATGGDISALAISPAGLIAGLLTAVFAAATVMIPASLLPEYGSPVVTGSAMMLSGIITCAFVQPWNNAPALDVAGIEALVVFIVAGSFLSYMLYMQGVKDLGGMRASMIATVEPVSAAVTSAILLGVAFSGADIAGFAAIIIMVFLTV